TSSWGVSAVGISTVALLWSIWQPKMNVRAKKATGSRLFELVIVLSSARSICSSKSPSKAVATILRLLDNSVRSRQHLLWNCQVDLLGSLEIDHQCKFSRLLNRQIRRLATFQNLVNIRSRSTEQIRAVRPVSH